MAAKKYDRETFSNPKLNRESQNYLNELLSLYVIPPRSGKNYTTKKHYYMINNERIGFTEKQLNLATLLVEGKLSYDRAYVKAGYDFLSHFAAPCVEKCMTRSLYTKKLTEEVKAKLTPSFNLLLSYLKKYSLEKMSIDAQWLLNEQVNLYLECRREKSYTNAARILNDIASHVDVNAKASSKVEIESSVDYAAVLSEAHKRVEKSPRNSRLQKQRDDDKAFLESERNLKKSKGVIEGTVDKELH